MKYENKDKVISLCNKIAEKERLAENLKDSSIVRITRRQCSTEETTMTIGIRSDSEHSYSKNGMELVNYITEKVEQEILAMKTELELL